MRVLDGHPFDQIFTHTDENGVTRHFNCGAIMRAIAQRKITPDFATVDIPESVYQHIQANHGIEEDHLSSITIKMLESPALLAHFDEGSDLLIDGSHRLVKRYRQGLRTIEVLVVQEKDWTPYLVTDIDQTYTLEEVGNMFGKLVPHGR